MSIAFRMMRKHINFANYRSLSMTVDNEVLKEFVTSILDSIIVKDGKVKTVVFGNGLSHTFIPKEPNSGLSGQ